MQDRKGGRDLIGRIFSGWAMLLLVGAALVAFVAGALVGRQKGETGPPVRAIEAALLAFLGGLLARATVSILMHAGHDSRGTGLAVGWGFLLYPGLLDTIARIGGKHLLTQPGELMWIATAVGAFSGMFDGIWKTHQWSEGIGVASFLLDSSWGMAGVTNGCLLHLVDFWGAGHGTETRTGAHRYEKGFRLKKDFAFTQGSVMSDLSSGPPDPLWRHERTHVWQNRAFGPFFVLSYVGWAILLAVPGLIAGGRRAVGPFEGAQRLSYFNNPWEVWAYKVQKAHGDNFREDQGELIWSDATMIGGSVVFAAVVLILAIVIVTAAWSQ